MIIKKAVYTKKRRTVNVRVSDDVIGCDCCKKKVKDEDLFLRMSVFGQDKDGTTLPSISMEFCSWKCLLRHLPKIKSNYFISLPYLSFDASMPKGATGQDFINLLKEGK